MEALYVLFLLSQTSHLSLTLCLAYPHVQNELGIA